ncbi:MAG: type II secretion system F family protein [Planctomycetaceae bacterium]|nr:type II secretion system F family protein [Planctomycetaceae bacterium]
MTTPNIALLQEVRARRYSENVANVFKLIGFLFLALVVAYLVMLLAAPHRSWETTHVLFLLFWVALFGALYVGGNLVILFWPILIYFWASVKSARQWTLLSLLQTAIETGKPLQDIIRAYAAGGSGWNSAGLNRFAASLESGYSLDAAIREHKGLFRYDVAGMVRLGDSPETLRSLEAVAQDERDFSAIRTYTVIRVIYLCTMCVWMLGPMAFMFLRIIPEFGKIFQDFDTQLPVLTAVVISVGNAFGMYWVLAVPFSLLFVAAAVVFLILQTNAVVFRPIGFRRIFRSIDSAKFLRIFAVGVRHRFAIPAILERYRWIVPSDYLRKKGVKIQKSVEQGGDWIDAVHRAGFVSGPEASLLKSAQRTGNTATMLDQLAQSKERLQICKDDLFSKLVFIPLVFLLGGVIGTFVVGMFLPLLKLITSLSAF